MFLFERVVKSDVIFVLSDRWLDDIDHANQCVLRSAAGVDRKIEIPVLRKGVAIDDVDVPDPSTWFPGMQAEVRRTYSGLPLGAAASDLVSQLLPSYTSPWLTDYLMNSFVVTLKMLGWKKEIVRGAALQRRAIQFIPSTCWICATRTTATNSSLVQARKSSLGDCFGARESR